MSPVTWWIVVAFVTWVAFTGYIVIAALFIKVSLARKMRLYARALIGFGILELLEFLALEAATRDFSGWWMGLVIILFVPYGLLWMRGAVLRRQGTNDEESKSRE